MNRVLAFTLAQLFYHRQVLSHLRKRDLACCDFVRRLAEQLLQLNPALDSS